MIMLLLKFLVSFFIPQSLQYVEEYILFGHSNSKDGWCLWWNSWQCDVWGQPMWLLDTLIYISWCLCMFRRRKNNVWDDRLKILSLPCRVWVFNTIGIFNTFKMVLAIGIFNTFEIFVKLKYWYWIHSFYSDQYQYFSFCVF